MSNITKPLMLDETGQAIKDAILQVAGGLNPKNGVIYGFHVNGNESRPVNMITYLKDAVGMTPAKMDYVNGVFDYGSWKDAFFMPRPCMLKYDGTVDYYLDPDDYTKKENGSASDVTNSAYAGNAMMEWGKNGKKIWLKIVPDADQKSGSVFIADHEVDSSYHAWSFINNQGQMVDHFYTPIYNGSNVSNVIRSISGQAPVNSLNGTTEIAYAKANNKGSEVLWYTEVLADVMLINFLLLLIGKSTDTQSVFGNGHYTGGSSASSLLNTGTMDKKGMFWGTNGSGSGVKVFGMENWWGNIWRRYAGHINASGTQKIKLTYGTKDGSTATSYNTDGSGYIAIGATPEVTSGGYISEMAFSKYGMFSKKSEGSQSTYYCDGQWFNNSQTNYAFRGGDCNAGFRVGALYCSLDYTVSLANWSLGASLSCKPLA